MKIQIVGPICAFIEQHSILICCIWPSYVKKNNFYSEKLLVMKN
jgi:hypothetical protein